MNENSEKNEINQNDASYSYTENSAANADSGSASFGSGSWESHGYDPDTQPRPERRKTGVGRKIIAAILCIALIGGVSFGAGYAGVMTARDAKTKVVIQQVTSEGDVSSVVTDASILTSEQVAEKVEQSVVAITTEIMKTNNYWYGNYVTSGAGSGVIISEDGYILTCAHVISGATKITVEMKDGTTYPAELVGKYVDGDIAVVKVDAQGLVPAEIADSDTVKQGSVCYAVGNPEGRFSGSISEGIVSSLGRQIAVQVDDESKDNGYLRGNSLYEMFFNMGGSSYTTIKLDVIQMTAAVSPGNSGGALFNDRGQLIGIVSAKSSDSASEGLGFAIPSNNAVNISSQLISNGVYVPENTAEDASAADTANRAILGITVSTITASDAYQTNMNPGVYVQSVTVKSTEDAGVQAGDRIISIDDVMVSQTSDLTGYLADKEPGDQVELNVERGGRLVSMTVTLVENS